MRLELKILKKNRASLFRRKMEYLNIDKLEAGCVVAKDVHSSSNMLLLPVGTALTTSQINMLKTWGIRRIFIDKIEDVESPEYIRIQENLDTKIKTLFLHNQKSPFINCLKLAVRPPLRRKLKGKK